MTEPARLDPVVGMLWWNSQTPIARAFWLDRAAREFGLSPGGASAADAYRCRCLDAQRNASHQTAPT